MGKNKSFKLICEQCGIDACDVEIINSSFYCVECAPIMLRAAAVLDDTDSLDILD